MKILVVVAHPDDEVLGMGGTIKKLSKAGNEIKTIFLSTGILARRPFQPKSSNNVLTEKFFREYEKNESGAILEMCIEYKKHLKTKYPLKMYYGNKFYLK